MTDTLHDETAQWAIEAATVPPNYDATPTEDAPPTLPAAGNEQPVDGAEEKDTHDAEALDALTNRVDMLEQDVARLLTSIAPPTVDSVDSNSPVTQ